MPALKINRFLSGQGDFQPVIEKAREIEALSKLLQGFLPPLGLIRPAAAVVSHCVV